MRRVRLARTDDLPALVELARLSGPGFTSLPEDEGRLSERLEISVASERGTLPAAKSAEYLLMLEESGSGAVLGCAAVKESVGVASPFYNFRLLTIAQASSAAARRFDMDVLMLVNEFTGCTEVGSLFLREEARGGGAGRLLAQSRYLLIAAEPDRFARRVVSELRGVVDDNGETPFWEHLGHKFFRMPFQDADLLTATTDKQFILDLMPRYPIYVDLLHEDARAVIGQTHRDGAGARALLEWEGFRYDRVIDIFDGGPLVSAPRSDIRTLRESRKVQVGAPLAGESESTMLISSDRIADFRVTRAGGVVEGETVRIAPETMSALDLTLGDTARIWVPEG